MLYVIVCLIRGEVNEFHEELVYNVCKKFEVKRQKLQSHFTIKAPFKTNNIELIENVTEQFSQRFSVAPFLMENYGHFSDRVTYMNIDASIEMIEICNNYLSELKNIPWLEWKRNETGHPNFHCTIVSKLPKGKFIDIWQYLNHHPYKFNCQFDNITIMHWDDDKWSIHKSYPLKLKER